MKMLPKFDLLTFLQTISLLIVSIDCEKLNSLIENSNNAFVKDMVHHEGNMNTEMEDEVIGKAVELSTKSNNSIVSSMANDLKQHLSETFNGTWFVMIGYGEISASWEKIQGDAFLRFSYKKIMFIVTQSKSLRNGFPSQSQLLASAVNKDIIKTGGGNLPDAAIIAEIKRLLSNGKIVTFNDLSVKLYAFVSKYPNNWSVNVDHIKYLSHDGRTNHWGYYDVNGIRIFINNYKSI